MQIYADNAATTKMSETALKAMLPFYGNITAILPVFTQWDKGRRMHWTVPAMR